MYKYEYVTLKGARFSGAKYTAHRETINEYAAKGFRFVGCIPASIAEHGKVKEIDLIFEKEE